MEIIDRRRALDRRAIASGAVVLFLIAIASAALLADPSHAETFGALGIGVGHTTAAIVMYRRSKSLPPRERLPWRLLSFGLLTAVLGLLVVAALGGEAPVIGPADAFFLGAYGILIMSLALMARMDPEGPPWGLTMLDAAVGAVAATAIVWEVVLGGLGTVQASPWERFGLSLYPILDIGIIVGLCVVVLRRSHFRFDLRIVMIALGLVFQVAGDLLYLRDGVQASNLLEAQPRFGLFVLASACYLSAAFLVDRSPGRKEFPDKDTPLWALVWPYLLAAALVPIHVLRLDQLLEEIQVVGLTPRETTQERVVLYALLLVAVLVFFRQLVAIRHNKDRVEEQRSELISSVSHELRTPLTAVLGFLQVLEEDAESFTDEERKSMLTEVANQAGHMSRTVTDLITLARDGGATMAIRQSDTSLAGVVAAAIRAADDVDVTTEIDDYVVQVDADRMAQAISHLVTNSRMYGHGRIHLRGAVANDLLAIEVHDDGSGIPTKHLTSIWNQFERGARRLDSTSPGIGVGLAIVRAVAAAHGGTASYRRSEVLGGACFSITVPTTAVAAPTTSPWAWELTHH